MNIQKEEIVSEHFSLNDLWCAITGGLEGMAGLYLFPTILLSDRNGKDIKTLFLFLFFVGMWNPLRIKKRTLLMFFRCLGLLRGSAFESDFYVLCPS